jgi:hypothetical protein
MAIEDINVPKQELDERPVTPEELSQYRSALMKLAWPVRQMIPQLAYAISYLASRVTTCTVADLRKQSTAIKEAKKLVSTGDATLKFRSIDLEAPLVVTFLDASFAKEEGMKSQRATCPS